MADIAAARRAIDEHILGVMFRGYIPEYGCCETYFHLCAFTTEGVTRDIARDVLRDLTDQGLCEFRTGLFTDEGEPAGSGYGMTRKGVETYLALSSQKRPESMGDWWKRQQSN